MQFKLLGRHPDSEVLLARVRAFGFSVNDKNTERVEVEREGRFSVVRLGDKVAFTSDDPRDRWLLSLALEQDRKYESCETYFLRQDGDQFSPVQIMLEATSGNPRVLHIVHGVVGSEPERHQVDSFDELMDVLPFLAPSNAVGYHRARGRVFVRYEQVRPKTWEDVGIADAGTIVEYERHRVRPEDRKQHVYLRAGIS